MYSTYYRLYYAFHVYQPPFCYEWSSSHWEHKTYLGYQVWNRPHFLAFQSFQKYVVISSETKSVAAVIESYGEKINSFVRQKYGVSGLGFMA